jgi:hypothetical protein
MTEDDLSPFDIFRQYFDCNYSVQADDTGAIVTNGTVKLKKTREFWHTGKLPLRFAKTSSFDVQAAGLTTLEGSPSQVGGAFFADRNVITSLEGGPTNVGLFYSVSNCPNLTSLKGAPQVVGGALIATHCKLPHFHDLSHSKIGRVIVIHNPIRSLLGIPQGCESIRCDYDPQLPLLRVVLPRFPRLALTPTEQYDEDMVADITDLIDFYHNKGIARAVPMAREFVRKGLPGNAVWEKDLP